VAELKRDVLDQISAYQTYVKRLRKADPEAYAMYRRVGAFVLPPDMLSDTVYLEPGVVKRLPAFGAIAFPFRQDTEPGRDGLPMVPCRFVWMTKLTKPGHDIQSKADGTIYRCTAYYDDIEDRKINAHGAGVCGEVAVHVARNGSVTPLKLLRSVPQVIHHKQGEWKGDRSTIYHKKWRFPDIGGGTSNLPNEVLIQRIFCMAMNFWAQAATQSMIRITATKSSVVMPFVVDVLDTPAFFADRDTTIGATGKKRQILHVVRPHVRANGTAVKLHFRGLRDFMWNGYQIRIVVPGREVSDLADMTFGALEDVPDDARDGLLEMDQVADIMASSIGTAPESLLTNPTS
jgi:hypothetical protein